MIWNNSLGITETIFILAFMLLYGIYIFRTYKKANYLRTTSKYVWLKFVLRSSYIILMILALLGPSFGETKQDVKSVGKDIFYLVDLSRSMDAIDIQPSRMERIKHELKGITSAFASDRQGIIIFSSEAFLQCPLTSDQSALKLILESLNTGLVPSGGTDFAPPLKMALEKFESDKETKTNSKIIIMISDGEDFGEETDDAIDEIEDLGIKLFALGIGTEQGGKIPSGSGFKKDKRTGETIITKLNPSDLQNLADQTGGKYFEIGETQNDVQRLINAVQAIQGEVRGVKQIDTTTNKYYYFLYAALFLAIIDVLFTIKVIKI
ncbi:vWA domain-containing protein [Bernardetia sp.]|uniref:vWA domain-containing protein n=1 Tax=Bernardetia sp. TaxID=1937974 RepID=UPI0025C2DB75|nr:VWA domain-containing protein [Bernardetia sp.]